MTGLQSIGYGGVGVYLVEWLPFMAMGSHTVAVYRDGDGREMIVACAWVQPVPLYEVAQRIARFHKLEPDWPPLLPFGSGSGPYRTEGDRTRTPNDPDRTYRSDRNDLRDLRPYVPT